MSSTRTSSPVPATTTGRRLRAAGWSLIGSFVGFVVAVATMIATGNGYDAALTEAAERRGVGLNDLPAEAIAPINRQYNDLPTGILTLCLVLLALGLFLAGVRLATWDSGGLGKASVAVAAVMPVCWLAVYALEYSIGVEEPERWFDLYDAAYDPAIAVSSVAGSLALLGVVVVLRRAGVARRTGLVVAVLAGLTVVTAVAVGAPPVVPLLLAAIVGIVMVRTARSGTAG
ncbi:hypothetical protein BWI15_07605 [Kribbella sp. ALI-6-A]|uniref:hypothetical protein n=1 Tax=Kribbella sp. ALI-6-A TaxID=1933817 RepID=UPI00097BF599|nr:hypothetical protein [Kribbella sp. ALI-6-A]ONI75688.1 hypothetical protein BWI15_07605 [Kribbella sp. ALI-6-A]